VIADLNKNEGLSVFLVEQNAYHALRLAHRGYVLVNGAITMAGSGAELLASPKVRAAYLEGGARKGASTPTPYPSPQAGGEKSTVP
jgi:branched-chain amino acid transport system ATP-binding protein